MEAEYYLIKKSTLVAIADAIREVNGTSDKIPVSSLATALSGEMVTATANEATLDVYLISRKTLVDITDALRVKLETTDEIAVKDLPSKILEAKVKVVILGKAILGQAILGTQ